MRSRSRTSARKPRPATLPPTSPQVPRHRSRGSSRAAPTPPTRGMASAARPMGKWTAFIKDHNVHVRPASGSEPVRLSSDGKEGLAYGRLSWSPDSKTLAAFRIEPGDRKEVYLIQSSPPGGGRAKFRARPYALPGDKFTAYELNLFDIAGRKQCKPSVDRIDYDEPHLRLEQGRPPLHLREDRPRPSAIPRGRGRCGHSAWPGTWSTRRPRLSSGPPTPRTST